MSVWRGRAVAEDDVESTLVLQDRLTGLRAMIVPNAAGEHFTQWRGASSGGHRARGRDAVTATAESLVGLGAVPR